MSSGDQQLLVLSGIALLLGGGCIAVMMWWFDHELTKMSKERKDRRWL